MYLQYKKANIWRKETNFLRFKFSSVVCMESFWGSPSLCLLSPCSSSAGHMRRTGLCGLVLWMWGGRRGRGAGLLGRGFPPVSSLLHSRGSKQRRTDVFGCVGKLFLLQSSGVALFFPPKPHTSWGSSLCCWLGWDTARYGDDCASYCLASAGAFTSRGKMGGKKPLSPTPTAVRAFLPGNILLNYLFYIPSYFYCSFNKK